jgi:hypothetical protein
LQFFLDARMESFLRGHIAAFQAWNGLPRMLLYDNLKSAVLERQGDAIRFHPTMLEFAGHYRYEPRPVAPARGNEKGRVERAIRYVRDSFFAARAFVDLGDLNAQASVWCNGQAADRICPADRELRVREAFAREQRQLLSLPDNPFVADEVVAVHVGKTPYARFDLNDYSVPHTHVQRTLTGLVYGRTPAQQLSGMFALRDRGTGTLGPVSIERASEYRRTSAATAGLRLPTAASAQADRNTNADATLVLMKERLEPFDVQEHTDALQLRAAGHRR